MDFESELRRYLTIQPDGWLLAMNAGTPVGMVGAIEYGPVAYVGLMAVDPPMQSRGIARALMARLLARLEERWISIVLLDASEAGRPLYVTLGFVEEDDAIVLERPAQEPVPARPARVRPLRAEDLPEVAEFDRTAFGADRSAALCALADDFPGGFLAIDEPTGELTGYLCVQGSRLGPWVAQRPADAEALLEAASTLPCPHPFHAIIPGRNRAGIALLERRGFRRVRTNRHMRRGGTGLLSRREMIYGQGSFGLG